MKGIEFLLQFAPTIIRASENEMSDDPQENDTHLHHCYTSLCGFISLNKEDITSQIAALPASSKAFYEDAIAVINQIMKE